MTTNLAKENGWAYEQVLARFLERFPDEAAFRKEMRRTEIQINLLTGLDYSWIADYDQQNE